MRQVIGRVCDQCGTYSEVEARAGALTCPECRKEWGKIESIGKIFDRCPVCGCRQFYLSKDFNQFLGCFVVGCGIVLVPWTYGLSLPFFALIDWLIYKKVDTVVNCYRCATEFKGVAPKKTFKPFMHHIGLKYDKYR